MKKTATILLSFSPFGLFKNINNKTFIRESKQSLHYIESRIIDSVDVANIRADELIADRYFDLTFEKALTSFDYVNTRGISIFTLSRVKQTLLSLIILLKFYETYT